MLNTLKTNALFAMYTVAFLIVSFGLVVETGTQYIHFIAIFYASLLVCYTFWFSMFTRSDLFPKIISAVFITSAKTAKTVSWIGIIGMIGLMLGHLISLGMNPTFTALLSNDYYYILHLRRQITYIDSTFWRYTVSFLIRAGIPFLLLFAYKNFTKKQFWGIAILFLLYSISLLSKSYVLIIFLPLITYVLLKKEFKKALTFITIVIGCLGFLVIVANPMLRLSQNQLKQDSEFKVESVPSQIKVDKSKSSLRITAEALGNRVFIVPGLVVGKWFECVPDSLPYLNGCGYRFIAGPKGCQFHNYPHELWPYVHPDYAAAGRVGTVNTASFMYDYVNWGWKGLLLSGLMLGFVLAFAERLFSNNALMKVAINGTAILWLSSTSLFTLLLTGGWGLMILLYAVLGKSLGED